MDDLSVFFGLLLARTFEPFSLALGVCLGSALVLVICKAATLLSPVVWVLERIPLFAIIGCFTVWTLVSAFVEI